MSLSDIIAAVVFFLCVILGICGFFKWLGRLIFGSLVGLVVLISISLLMDHPVFDKYSHGVLRGGVILPYMEQQYSILNDFLHNKTSVDNNRSASDPEIISSIPPRTKANTSVSNE